MGQVRRKARRALRAGPMMKDGSRRFPCNRRAARHCRARAPHFTTSQIPPFHVPSLLDAQRRRSSPPAQPPFTPRVCSPGYHNSPRRHAPVPHRHTTAALCAAVAARRAVKTGVRAASASTDGPRARRHGAERQRRPAARARTPLQRRRARRVARAGQDVQVPARGRHEAPV
jgi:hypothetical protein